MNKEQENPTSETWTPPITQTLHEETKAPSLPPPMTSQTWYQSEISAEYKCIKNAKVIDEGDGYINLVDNSGNPFAIFKNSLSGSKKDPLNESNELMYHGINSGLFLYGSAWTSAIVMGWCMFLNIVPSGVIQWVLIGIMILIGILNYPVKSNRNPTPKVDKKDERPNN